MTMSRQAVRPVAQVQKPKVQASKPQKVRALRADSAWTQWSDLLQAMWFARQAGIERGRHSVAFIRIKLHVSAAA
jgi:hypothetical protein